MPATAAEPTRAQSDTTRETPDRRPNIDARDLTARDWEEIARALTATDADDVPLFGRLPA